MIICMFCNLLVDMLLLDKIRFKVKQQLQW